MIRKEVAVKGITPMRGLAVIATIAITAGLLAIVATDGNAATAAQQAPGGGPLTTQVTAAGDLPASK